MSVRSLLESRWAILIGCVALSLLAYLPSLSCGFVNDDFVLIHSVSTKGPFGHFSVPPTDYFRPLVSLMFWVSWKVFGLSATGYHVLNALANGLCGFALWLLLGRIVTAAAGARLSNWTFWRVAAAAAFVILPSHLEPVNWAAGTSDLWMSFFALLSLYYFLGGLRNARSLVTSLVLFAGSLCFKETALALVVVAPVLALVLREGESAKRVFLVAVPLIVVAGAFFFVRMEVIGTGFSQAREASSMQLTKPTKVAGNLAYYPLRALTGGLPIDRIFGQPYETNAFGTLGREMKRLAVWFGLGFLVALGLFIVLLRQSSRAGLLKLQGALALAFYAFCGPTVVLYVAVNSSQNERYLYLPSAFLIMALAIALSATKRQGVAAAVSVAAGLGMGFSLVRSEGDWQRSSAIAQTVYDRLPELNAISAETGRSVLILVNAPDALRGYPIAGNCLFEALHVLHPSSTARVAILSRPDQTAADVEVTVSGDTVSFGPGGFVGSVAVAVPAGPDSLPARIRFTQVNESSYSFERVLADDEVLVLFSNGHFRAVP